MSASTFSGVKRLWKSDIVLLPVLKADSGATVVEGSAKTSRDIFESVGYSIKLLFHQESMSKVSVLGIVFLFKYVSSLEGTSVIEDALLLKC
jgi:hypothetical protein